MGSSSAVSSASEEVIDRFLDNVDVWKTIFEMLSVKDRIRLEMTNKRLRIMMLVYWKRVTSFDTKCLTEISCYPWTSKDREKVSAAFVSICVNRMGDGLRSLIIHQRLTSLKGSWSDNLRSIGEGCQNIETINFAYENEYREYIWPFDIRFDSFSRLKTLTVSRGSIISASASVFLSIPTSIEVIRGLRVAFGDAAEMEGFFADRPSLKEIDLSELKILCWRGKADMFRVIAERCPHLKSITLSSPDCIDFRGVVALESMKKLWFWPLKIFDEMEIVTICERSPLVEALSFTLPFSSNTDLQSAALNALGALTKLAQLCLNFSHGDGHVVALSLVTDFVRELARNSGASLRRLHLGGTIPLPTAAIESLANGCPKLRDVTFSVRVGEATPASIRFLIDCIVAHPSWIHQTSHLQIIIWVDEGEAEAGHAAFKPLTYRAANLPTGVQLRIFEN